MSMAGFQVVTGAYSYTGRYLTRRLLEQGAQVKTLTNHPDRPDPFAGRVAAMPFNFEQPEALARSLEGASVLYNTYWVRYAHSGTTYGQAIANTKVLVQAAQRAGVRRLVHVSIANADPSSRLPYYRGKGELEQFIRASGLPHALIGPTVIYSLDDVLINNIAWILRRFPVFGVPGRGDYGLQPIHIDDMVDVLVQAGQRSDNYQQDAVGPEQFSFTELVRLIARSLGRAVLVMPLPSALALRAAQAVGMLVNDVVLTRDEVDGLMAGLLVSRQSPAGRIRLSSWLSENASRVGARYASELNRHFR